MSTIGITTTVPVEILYAAGKTPLDLNNVFISRQDANRLVEEAEEAGYPRNICGWIKGLYSVVLDEGIQQVLAVTQGDCSNTHALMETLQVKGVQAIPFAYPYDRDYDMLKLQMDKLIQQLGTDWETVEQWKRKLDTVRRKVAEVDRRTWETNQVSGWDNHVWQVSCSDFDGSPEEFERRLDVFLAEVSDAPERTEELRLGFIGVPPIVGDLYEYLEKQGARVVFNEVQRQFSMPFVVEDIVEQYRCYTYPYGVFGRIEDILAEIERRNLDGIIHYVQSFCFRQIEDMIFRERLGLPLLTLEGDKPGRMDARTRLRIDSFIDMIR